MPAVAAQLASPELLVILSMQVAQLVAAMGIIAIGSDTSWSIRRSLFEQGKVAHYRLLELLGHFALTGFPLLSAKTTKQRSKQSMPGVPALRKE